MKWITVTAMLAVGWTIEGHEATRVQQINADRDRKEQYLQPEEPSKTEKRLDWLKDSGLMERATEGYHGLRVKLGGLAPGGGFAIGPVYSQEGLLGGRLNLRAGSQASFRGYRKHDMHVAVPRFLHDRLSLDLYAVHHNYPGLNFYGSGPESNRQGRSNYRLKDTALDATVSVDVAPRLRAGASAGYVFNDVGPGTDRRFASADTIYDVPGLQTQSNFARTGAFVQYDYRDFAPGPRSGGNYIAQFHHFTDRTLGEHSFRRLDLEAQQYIPVFNKRRVFALRVKSVTTYTSGGRSLPFYMQPMLGGSDDLRGYRPFRFRGDNLLLANAEYRWEVFSGLDMAVFGDAGKVYMQRTKLDLSNLETNAGFGFRFNARNQTFMRLDVGFSHEGYQVSVKFNDLFRKGPVHTSSSQGDF
jgi:outer membrane protein assembly factor BamA